MLLARRASALWLAVLVWALCDPARSAATLSFTVSSIPGFASYYIFVFQEITINSDGTTNGPATPFDSITNRGTNVPFQVIMQVPGTRYIYKFTIAPALDSLAETYSLAGSGWSLDYTLQLVPGFTLQPQSQSAFVGSTLTLSAQAVHTTGYQWQKDGTNLVESAHLVGTTNGTLNIIGTTREDTGAYLLVADHPVDPVPSATAMVAVFKPIVLALAPVTTPAVGRLQASNLDGSPFEPERLAKVDFYSTTNLSLDFSGWDYATNSAVLTNGMLELDFPRNPRGIQLWRAVERP